MNNKKDYSFFCFMLVVILYSFIGVILMIYLKDNAHFVDDNWQNDIYKFLIFITYLIVTIPIVLRIIVFIACYVSKGEREEIKRLRKQKHELEQLKKKIELDIEIKSKKIKACNLFIAY